MKKLSIITPVYNGERFIESCLQNVIDQNCTDVEHLIIDGGSVDATMDIVKQYASLYSHIRWVSEKDKGQSDAMNKGLGLANGSIVGFLNADDFYEPYILNRILTYFEGLPEPSLLVGNCNVFRADGILSFVNRPKKLKIQDLLYGSAANPIPMNPSAYFYHVSLHNEVGSYNVEEHYCMDVDFILKAVQTAHVQYFDELWGNYRQLPGTKTAEDLLSGEQKARLEILMKEYWQHLPLFQRWYVPIAYRFYRDVDWPRYKYFLDDPMNAVRVLRKKAATLASSQSKTP